MFPFDIDTFLFLLDIIFPIVFVLSLFCWGLRSARLLLLPHTDTSHKDSAVEPESESEPEFDSEAFAQEYYMHPWDIPPELLYRGAEHSGDKLS